MNKVITTNTITGSLRGFNGSPAGFCRREGTRLRSGFHPFLIASLPPTLRYGTNPAFPGGVEPFPPPRDLLADKSLGKG